MKKGIKQETKLSKLLKEFSFLRIHRSRNRLTPFRLLSRKYRKELEDKLKGDWPGGYVLLENNDYQYVPYNVDSHGILVFAKPPRISPIINKFCKPGGTVLDIGANIGEWSLPMAKAVGDSGSLFAFEPVPFLCDALNKTFIVNGLFHAKAESYAISSVSENTSFSMVYSSEKIVDTGISKLGNSNSQESESIQVQTITLDEFVKDYHLDNITFIKIDVEGHEAEVIQGGIKTLHKYKPVLVIETGNESYEDRSIIRKILNENDYQIIGLIAERGIIPLDWDEYIEYSDPLRTGRADNILLIPEKI